MAREKLFPGGPPEDKRKPRERFADMAARVFAVATAPAGKRKKPGARRAKRARRR